MSAGPKLKTKSFSLEREIGLYFFFPRRTYFLTAPGLKPYTGPHLETSGDLHGKGREESMWKKDLNYTTTQGFHDRRNQQSRCSQALIWTVEAWVCLTPSSLLPVSSLLSTYTYWLTLQAFVSSLMPRSARWSIPVFNSLRFNSLLFGLTGNPFFQEPRWHSLPLFIKRLIIEAIMGVSAVLQNAWTKMQLVPVCREWTVAVSLWGESWFFGLRLPSPDNLYFWKLLRRL